MRKSLSGLQVALLVVPALWILFPPTVSGEVFGVPISNFVVSGTVTLPSGVTASFHSREGTLITVRDDAKNYWYAFVAKLDEKLDEKSHQPVPVFSPYTVHEENGRTSIAYVHPQDSTRGVHVPVPIGKRGVVRTDSGRFYFEVAAVSVGDYPDPLPISSSVADLENAYGDSGGGVCCLASSSITICSSSLAAPFGICEGGKRWLP